MLGRPNLMFQTTAAVASSMLAAQRSIFAGMVSGGLSKQCGTSD
jgi:hypothetical protein